MPKKLAEILEDCRVMVQNSQNDAEIKAAISPLGYTDEKLLYGVTLYSETLALFTKQGAEKQDVNEMNDEFTEARESAEEEYEKICRLGRVVFRPHPELQDLIPAVLVYSPFDSLNAYKMYDNIQNNPKALAVFTPIGITSEVLDTRKAELDALELLQNQRNIEKGEAQQATQDRNAKLEELRDYCRDLKEMARIALADRPQLLEKLGVLVRS